MSKNKYVNLQLKYCTLLHTFICLNTWSLFQDISLCAFLNSRSSYIGTYIASASCFGSAFPTPCHLALTLAQPHSSGVVRSPLHTVKTVCSFLGFSSSERALSTVSIDSFLPAASGWPPGMTSISRGARSQYSRAVKGVFAAAFGT